MDKRIKYGKSPIEYTNKHIARQKLLDKVRKEYNRIKEQGMVEDATITDKDLNIMESGGINIESWAKSCLSKNRYPNKNLAQKVKADCERERKTPLRIYKCKHCSGWHMTSTNVKG